MTTTAIQMKVHDLRQAALTDYQTKLLQKLGFTDVRQKKRIKRPNCRRYIEGAIPAARAIITDSIGVALLSGEQTRILIVLEDEAAYVWARSSPVARWDLHVKAVITDCEPVIVYEHGEFMDDDEQTRKLEYLYSYYYK